MPNPIILTEQQTNGITIRVTTWDRTWSPNDFDVQHVIGMVTRRIHRLGVKTRHATLVFYETASSRHRYVRCYAKYRGGACSYWKHIGKWNSQGDKKRKRPKTGHWEDLTAGYYGLESIHNAFKATNRKYLWIHRAMIRRNENGTLSCYQRAR